MPVAAIGGAIWGGATLATAAAGTLSAFQVISAVGAIASGIGAVTKNEDLMKIGGVVAMAGGIGSFAQGQGWINPEQSNIGAMNNAPTPGVTPNAPNPAADYGGAQGSNAIELGQGGVEQSMTQQAIAQPTAGLADSTTPGLVNSGADIPANNVNPTDMRLNDGAQTSPLASSPAGMSGPAKQRGIFDTFTDLLKNDKGQFDKDKLSMAWNFVGGAFDDKKKAESKYMKARTAELEAQMRNGSAVPDISGMKVVKKDIFKPGAPTYNPVRVGLINAKA